MTESPTAFSNKRAADFISRRVHHLRHRRSQGEIAKIAGFVSPNMISMIKSGVAKIPLARIPDLAKALDCDPSHLMRIGLEQHMGLDVVNAITSSLGGLVSKNEMEILHRIREVSKNGDPELTPSADELLVKCFGSK